MAISLCVCVCVCVHVHISFYTKMNVHFPANNLKIPTIQAIKNRGIVLVKEDKLHSCDFWDVDNGNWLQNWKKKF